MLASIFGYMLTGFIDRLPENADYMTLFLESPALLFDVARIFIYAFAFYIIASTIINSFFIPSSISMALKATESRKVTIRDIVTYGRKYYTRIMLSNVIINTITFMGVIALAPGLNAADESFDSLMLLASGLLIWGCYIFIISIVCSMVKYAIVIEDLSVIEGFRGCLHFFKTHFPDIFIIWLLGLILIVLMNVVIIPMSFSPSTQMIGHGIRTILTIVIMTLTIVWFTRLYLTRMQDVLELRALSGINEV
ncbi:MAG: hypothetical protein EF806_04825 [Candidatus Methanoliparum thermophilum]|uniref:DUF7847 domain-containing protein n=1 Tax=Methanoliparum thermophilum TaxID=2491083 RepID=A0A520KRI3_METT2|nr:hypothetical protein [Candidatus Methanoliparum sp. LAM-1]RZN64303.1 MAG: hypothetical protein EF806_04825 [Candidatus Methanoliparum thermophilum]BDC35563.1 hypothetical protein MTLP_02450 [Candidatus Methanoliparum sp. LAM-1]